MFRIAGAWWREKGLNELADRGDAAAFREITRRMTAKTALLKPGADDRNY
jgi:predicted chitinase